MRIFEARCGVAWRWECPSKGTVDLVQLSAPSDHQARWRGMQTGRQPYNKAAGKWQVELATVGERWSLIRGIVTGKSALNNCR